MRDAEFRIRGLTLTPRGRALAVKPCWKKWEFRVHLLDATTWGEIRGSSNEQNSTPPRGGRFAPITGAAENWLIHASRYGFRRLTALAMPRTSGLLAASNSALSCARVTGMLGNRRSRRIDID